MAHHTFEEEKAERESKSPHDWSAKEVRDHSAHKDRERLFARIKESEKRPPYQTHAYDRAERFDNGANCYGSGHDMKQHGEGKEHGKS